MKIVGILVVVFGVGGAVAGSAVVDSRGVESVGVCAADEVTERMFELLGEGDAKAAVKLFRATNTQQQAAVSKYVTGGIRFLRRVRVETRVVDVFTAGPFAVCALEQTSPDYPEMHELEAGCLVQVEGCWRLLPQPQNHRTPVNELTPQEASTFDVLLKRFATLKTKYKAYQAANKP